MRPEPQRPYRPQLPAKDWRAISPYVHDVVARAAPSVTYSERELFPAVTRLVLFAFQNKVPLEDGAVFGPRTVERFVHAHLDGYNRASRNTIRARLRRVSEALLGDAAVGHFKALGKAAASAPYTAVEVSLLRAWGRSMRTDELTSSAGALLALGFGAGLTGAEIIRHRVEDVSADQSTVTVRGDAARVVPVTEESWRDLLAVRRTVLHGSGFTFRAEQRGANINLVTDFVSRTHPQIPLTTRRMRATWLVQHLNAGTPLKQLLRIAGLQSAEALDRVLPYADE